MAATSRLLFALTLAAVTHDAACMNGGLTCPGKNRIHESWEGVVAEMHGNPAARTAFEAIDNAYELACDITSSHDFHTARYELWKGKFTAPDGTRKDKFDTKVLCTAKHEPAPFDSRQKWGRCIADSVSQGNCGACYAWSIGFSISDRLCIRAIATKQQLEQQGDLGPKTKQFLAFVGSPTGKPFLSVQSLVSCGGGIGCYEESQDTANSVRTALASVHESGLPTTECEPVLSSTEDGITGECQPCCASGTNKVKFHSGDLQRPDAHDPKLLSHSTQKHQVLSGKVPYPMGNVIAAIYNRGPVSVGFSYSDDFQDHATFQLPGGLQARGGQFVFYAGWKTGKPKPKAGHAVTILGWGKGWAYSIDKRRVVENVPYWLVRNSHGAPGSWGRSNADGSAARPGHGDGTFKMIRCSALDQPGMARASELGIGPASCLNFEGGIEWATPRLIPTVLSAPDVISGLFPTQKYEGVRTKKTYHTAVSRAYQGPFTYQNGKNQDLLVGWQNAGGAGGPASAMHGGDVEMGHNEERGGAAAHRPQQHMSGLSLKELKARGNALGIHSPPGHDGRKQTWIDAINGHRFRSGVRGRASDDKEEPEKVAAKEVSAISAEMDAQINRHFTPANKQRFAHGPLTARMEMPSSR
jgi:hypothetical protein